MYVIIHTYIKTYIHIYYGKIRNIEMGGVRGTCGGGGEEGHKEFCKKPKGKRLQGRFRCMWEYYIAMRVKKSA